MPNLCSCSKLEWLPEHYNLEHHPDCDELPQWFKENYFALSKGRPVYEDFDSRDIPMKTTTVEWNDTEARPYYRLYCTNHGFYYEGFEREQRCPNCHTRP